MAGSLQEDGKTIKWKEKDYSYGQMVASTKANTETTRKKEEESLPGKWLFVALISQLIVCFLAIKFVFSGNKKLVQRSTKIKFKDFLHGLKMY